MGTAWKELDEQISRAVGLQRRACRVEVKVKNVGKDVEISVVDSGKGIPRQFRDKVGQPFYRAGIEHFERNCGSAWRAFEPGRGVRAHTIRGDTAEGGGGAESGGGGWEVAKRRIGRAKTQIDCGRACAIESVSRVDIG